MSSLPFMMAGNSALFDVDDELNQWIVSIRRHIHQNPELSLQEYKTALFIQEKLSELGIAYSTGHGGTGVVALMGENNQGPCVGLRADMDALPIVEATGLPFSSQSSGIMHACGHDGHIAMLLGAAALLKRQLLPGRVKLVFQPAEEHGNGASILVEEGIVKDVDVLFTGHIDTHFRTGIITVDHGLICAYADPFSITIRGRSGHAARPHEAVDAVVAAASLVMMVQPLVSRGVDPNKAEVITIGSFQAGTACNIIAGEARLKGTIRSTDKQTRSDTIKGLSRVVRSIETMYGVEAELVFEQGLPAVVNSLEAANIARRAAWDVVAENDVISQGAPSLGAEDFAFYQQVTDGCMVRFGGACNGGAGPAHSNTFDFDEACLTVGARWFAAVALQWLKEPGSVVDFTSHERHGC